MQHDEVKIGESYLAITREIAMKGDHARFRKTERERYELARGAVRHG